MNYENLKRLRCPVCNSQLVKKTLTLSWLCHTCKFTVSEADRQLIISGKVEPKTVVKLDHGDTDEKVTT